MGHLLVAVTRVLSALETAGVRATADPRNVNPPTVLVVADSSVRRSTGVVAVTVHLNLISPGPANLDAVHVLDTLESNVTPALDAAGIPWQNGSIFTTPSPSSGEQLLTYQLLGSVQVHTHPEV